ncbi:HD-GYP domain-containing protein [Pontibacillus sp. HMF3514]|uniref:HD-GYP domain-containing protein n=1 Tax=Pontibacillus sp. HMF3514 TaxID=2692425 RepID=UPI0013201A13|nr:HD-GYP domain-containing protein [Pontibacillus sp. HMF3514]QHE53642.1 HD domain-containing protein [Pontibacillus sp. HMF3514]
MFKIMMGIIDGWHKPHWPHYVFGYLSIGCLTGIVWMVVYLTGGTMYVFLHLMYIPVILAGFLFRMRGGMLFGLLGGVILGPFMPLDVANDLDQTFFSMLYRTFFFILVGSIVGKMASILRERLGEITLFLDTISSIYENTLENYVKIIEMRDNKTSQHCERVAYNAWLLGKHIGLKNDELEALYWSGLLHDLGKIGVSENILLKPGKLTAEEYDEMKKHTEIGSKVLLNISPSFARIASGVRSHHEKWAGHGYPDGLKGEGIPLFGRILVIVDIFEALTSSRPYKEAVSPSKALETMMKTKYRDFDPYIFVSFVELYSENRIWIEGHPYKLDPSFEDRSIVNTFRE